MSRHDTHNPDAASFETIRAVLSQSVRGREFLAELARRSHAQETRQLLDAIARLERRIAGRTAPDGIERRRCGLAEVTSHIAQARRDVADLVAGIEVSGGPDAAGARILDAAGQIGVTAWRMREGGLDPALCDALDRHASEISSACAARDAAAEQAARVAGSLRQLEARLGLAREALAATEPGTECGMTV